MERNDVVKETPEVSDEPGTEASSHCGFDALKCKTPNIPQKSLDLVRLFLGLFLLLLDLLATCH